jgi:hypothetical protein
MEKITAAIAGATGLVGGFVLRVLLEDPAVERVIAPTRRGLQPHPKLANPLFGGVAWPAMPPLQEAYGCLGTTRAKAGSAAAFRAVDLDMTAAFARTAKTAGARRFGLVSSLSLPAGQRRSRGGRRRSRLRELRPRPALVPARCARRVPPGGDGRGRGLSDLKAFSGRALAQIPRGARRGRRRGHDRSRARPRTGNPHPRIRRACGRLSRILS